MLIEKYRETIWRTTGQVNADQLLEETSESEESYGKTRQAF